MTKTLLPLCAVLFLLPSAALAAPAGSGDKSWVDADEGANVTQHNDGTREYVIDDGDDITGQKLSPGGADIQSRRGREHANLITIRPHFMDEMVLISLDI